MSRAGQPPQRPPSLAPNPALGGPYRGPYPGYGMPPRNVMPGYPALQNHRAGPNLVAQPSPNLFQQRGQNNFGFASGGLQQSQSQHTGSTALHTPVQQQSQPSSATSTLPPHLAQSATPSLGTAPSVSSASEVGLDPNDFPALGSTPATNSNAASSTNATSYASQAGTGVMGAGSAGAQAAAGTGGTQDRNFGPDDFPALGGQSQTAHQQPQTQPHTADGHPPGLNGFQQQADQQHRQNLLGSLTVGGQTPSLGSGQQQPGVLNLGGQARGVHPGFQSQSDAEKQRVRPGALTRCGTADAFAELCIEAQPDKSRCRRCSMELT